MKYTKATLKYMGIKGPYDTPPANRIDPQNADKAMQAIDKAQTALREATNNLRAASDAIKNEPKQTPAANLVKGIDQIITNIYDSTVWGATRKTYDILQDHKQGTSFNGG